MTGAELGGDSSSGFALIEMVFSFGVVLAIAIWQWWQVRDAKYETRPNTQPDPKPDDLTPGDQEKPNN